MDLLLRNARLLGTDRPTDIAVEGGLITSLGAGPVPAGVGAGDVDEIDLGGRLVTPPLVEPHIHLDAVLTVGQPRPNVERLAVRGHRGVGRAGQGPDRRGRQATGSARCCAGSSPTACSTCAATSTSATRELRRCGRWSSCARRSRGLIDLQLVAFPQQGILGFDGGADADAQGGRARARTSSAAIPHYELTREDGVESVRFAMALADEHGLRVDIHCDETDDDHSRFVEVMAAETIRRGMSGRVTASHTTAMHSYNAAYAYRLINNIARAGLHMVTNPLDNAVLQGRFDTGPIRRGHTRVKELQAAGVNVAIGHDSVMDPWYPLGLRRPAAGRVRARPPRAHERRRRSCAGCST